MNAKLLVWIAACALLCGCATGTVGGSRYVPKPFGSDFKPIDEVAPHARAMVEGRMSLAECLQQPESKADHGVGCMKAIRDLPTPH